MTRYADPNVCPGCAGLLVPGARSCPTCGLDLSDDLAQELFTALTTADRLLARMQQRRDGTRATAAHGRRHGTATRSRPDPEGHDGAARLPGARRRTGAGPPRRSAGAVRGRHPEPGLRPSAVPKILLSLGAICLMAAAVVFLVVTWSSLGVGGRTAILLAFTVAMAALTTWSARRGFRGAVEALGLVSIGLLALDLAGAESAGWFGTPSDSAFAMTCGLLLVAVGVLAAWASRRTPAGAFVGAEVVAVISALVAFVASAGLTWGDPVLPPGGGPARSSEAPSCSPTHWAWRAPPRASPSVTAAGLAGAAGDRHRRGQRGRALHPRLGVGRRRVRRARRDGRPGVPGRRTSRSAAEHCGPRPPRAPRSRSPPRCCCRRWTTTSRSRWRSPWASSCVASAAVVQLTRVARAWAPAALGLLGLAAATLGLAVLGWVLRGIDGYTRTAGYLWTGTPGGPVDAASPLAWIASALDAAGRGPHPHPGSGGLRAGSVTAAGARPACVVRRSLAGALAVAARCRWPRWATRSRSGRCCSRCSPPRSWPPSPSPAWCRDARRHPAAWWSRWSSPPCSRWPSPCPGTTRRSPRPACW